MLLLLACASSRPSALPPGDLSEEYARVAEEGRHPLTPDRVIMMLEGYLADGAEGALRATVLLKLAEIHGEAYRQAFLRELEAFETCTESCYQDPGCDLTALELDSTASHAHLRAGIAALEQLHAEHPDFARLDEARYMLGWYSEDLGEHEASIAHYARLIEAHPGSAWAPDAWLAIAEERFSEGRMGAAGAAYRAVIAADNGRREYAVYKLAWCHFNLRETDVAITLLEEMIADPSPERTRGVRDEAVKDLVMFYAVEGDLERALVGLSSHPASTKLIARLARLLVELERPAQAATVWTMLLAAEPMSPDAARWAAERIRCGVAQGAPVEAALEAMRATYGPGSEWAAANPTAVEAAAEFMREAAGLLP